MPMLSVTEQAIADTTAFLEQSSVDGRVPQVANYLDDLMNIAITKVHIFPLLFQSSLVFAGTDQTLQCAHAAEGSPQEAQQHCFHQTQGDPVKYFSSHFYSHKVSALRAKLVADVRSEAQAEADSTKVHTHN